MNLLLCMFKDNEQNIGIVIQEFFRYINIMSLDSIWHSQKKSEFNLWSSDSTGYRIFH